MRLYFLAKVDNQPRRVINQAELSNGPRFAFGKNWAKFLCVLNDARINAAEVSLCKMLQVDQLNNKRFLDIGSGSGLFSLAARRLGAAVHSFDYDPHSVACTKELRRRYFSDDPKWIVERGSVLDTAYMQGLGRYDIVYSWGVLHHTGAMWLGIENAIGRVEEEGQLFIAIYNDQGLKSRIWWLVKWVYNRLPRPFKKTYAYILGFLNYAFVIVKYILLLKPMEVITPILNYNKNRGMCITSDLIDWIGGFPYEFASYEVLIRYFECRGFKIVNSRIETSLGCHEIVLKKLPHISALNL